MIIRKKYNKDGNVVCFLNVFVNENFFDELDFIEVFLGRLIWLRNSILIIIKVIEIKIIFLKLDRFIIFIVINGDKVIEIIIERE